MPEKKEKPERTDVDIIGTSIMKFLIITCLPWVLISKLDRQLDVNSEEGFEWWDFYWSFPATHLSWLILTLLFGLPLLGLVGAPVVLCVCVITGVVELSSLAIILSVVITAVIWLGLYKTVQHYRSLREIREVRGEVFESERGDLNEA